MKIQPARRVVLVVALAGLFGCDAGSEWVAVPGGDGVVKSASDVRDARRAYDGAPPVIPHEPLGAPCTSCHNQEGLAVVDLGYAPPSPHGQTAGMGEFARCQQCHVFQAEVGPWRGSRFASLPVHTTPRAGTRAYAGAPPTLPHPAFGHENCLACHSGPAAREEIRTTHPERRRCQQCHVPQASTATVSMTPFTTAAEPSGASAL